MKEEDDMNQPKPIDLSDLANLPDNAVFSNGSSSDRSGTSGSGSNSIGNMAPGNWKKILKSYARKRSVQASMVVSALALLIVVGVAVGLFVLAKRPQLLTNSSQLDQSTLYIDSSKHNVGVHTNHSPDGLQVGSTVTSTAQDSANIRLGLENAKDPTLIFDDGQKNTWQVLGAGGSLQFIQGGTNRAQLDSSGLTLNDGLNNKGNTTLGGSAASQLTIQGTQVNVPNNLSFNNNTLFIGNNGTVAVGAASSGGYKLYVAGSFRAGGTIYADGQILATAGSAKNPGFAFTNNSNSGLYRAGLNVIGLSVGGVQVVQVQAGSLLTVGGANIEADGFLRGGRGSNNPAFRVVRFTGGLDGSGSAVINTGLGTGYGQVLVAQAFYQGINNNAVPLTIDYVNGGTMSISGGVPGRAFRASLIYSQDSAGW